VTRRPRARAAKSAKTRSRLPGRLALGLAVLITAVGLCFAAFIAPGPPAPQGSHTTVVLAPGSGLRGIAGGLERAGVIRSSLLFMVAAEASGAASTLKAGEYDFASGASLRTVLDAIRRGAVVRHYVTIPEGLTSRAAVEILNRAAELTGEAAIPAEGALLPETYEVRRGEDRSEVLRRMMEAHDRLMASLWPDRDPGLPYRSPREAETLASVVERETARDEERPHVAAVFLNRLKRGMPLASDPTVIYGLTGGAPLGHGLRRSELASITPYNTYHVTGLPPTPIANPGRAALIAALHPSESDLYFVADGSGGHVFSDSLAAHEVNVAHWRGVEKARSRAP